MPVSCPPLDHFDVGMGKEVFEYLFDVDLYAVVGETEVAEHGAQNNASLLPSFVD